MKCLSSLVSMVTCGVLRFFFCLMMPSYYKYLWKYVVYHLFTFCSWWFLPSIYFLDDFCIYNHLHFWGGGSTIVAEGEGSSTGTQSPSREHCMCFRSWSSRSSCSSCYHSQGERPKCWFGLGEQTAQMVIFPAYIVCCIFLDPSP